MDFTHSEERRLLSNTIEKFIANDYPLSHRMINASSDLGFSLESWKKLNDLGINFALFSEQFNGFGGEGFDMGLAAGLRSRRQDQSWDRARRSIR